MLLTIEKVAILSGIPLFANVPGNVLASVAGAVEEVDLRPGETFIEEGTVEDCLYIIVEGQVRIHNRNSEIAVMGAGQSVGELAVLDPEPRSASVSTLDETRLFRLNKEAFDEVMADRPEIATSVIRSLCQIIRERTRS